MSQSNTIPSLFEKMNTKVFFLLLFLYQFIFTLQGIDFLDEGFTATFYQQFFSDPSSVEYNFMFWLSGLVGGTFTYLFPDTGLLGLRFLSIIFTTSTILIVYNLLKDYLNKGHLKIGLLLVTMCVCHNPKIFHYNFLSILLYAATASLLFNGLKKNKVWLLFLSGTMVGLDVFSRLPSLVNLGLIAAIAYYGCINKTPIKNITTQVICFLSGFGLAAAAVIVSMKAMGHWEIFVKAFKLVTQMGMEPSDGEAAYGLSKLIKQSLGSYNDAFFFTLYILALIVIAALAPAYLEQKFRLKKWILNAIKFVSLLLALLIMLKGLEILMRFYVGLTIITFALIMFSNATKELKTLMLISTYICLAYALGSSAGIFTAGVHIFWLAIPIAIDYILNLKTFSYRFWLTTQKNEIVSDESVVSQSQFGLIKSAIIGISILGGLYHQWFYPMHDETSRLGMFYNIDNKYVKGIFTTKERVDATNQLLQASDKFVKPGDYTLAFHSLPIYHYMTNTKPFTRNPMPWYYVSGTFKTQLYKAVEETRILPVVIVQKIKTTPNDHGDWPDAWPSDPIFHKPETDVRTIRQQEYMNEFLEKYEYHTGWENDLFKIMVTERKL